MSERTSSPVRIERPAEGVALVTIDRAVRLNTLSLATLDALGVAMRELAASPEVAAVVLTGAGGEAFAAGADIREFASLDCREALAFAARGQRVFDLVELAPQAVLAAIDGVCMGGGLDLALSCDVRIATPQSVFAHPGARLGILTGFGGTARLARTVGVATAIEMFATARRFSAAEALAVGLVDSLSDDALGSALERASTIAARGPAEVAALKAAAVLQWRRP